MLYTFYTLQAAVVLAERSYHGSHGKYSSEDFLLIWFIL